MTHKNDPLATLNFLNNSVKSQPSLVIFGGKTRNLALDSYKLITSHINCCRIVKSHFKQYFTVISIKQLTFQKCTNIIPISIVLKQFKIPVFRLKDRTTVCVRHYSMNLSRMRCCNAVPLWNRVAAEWSHFDTHCNVGWWSAIVCSFKMTNTMEMIE